MIISISGICVTCGKSRITLPRLFGIAIDCPGRGIFIPNQLLTSQGPLNAYETWSTPWKLSIAIDMTCKYTVKLARDLLCAVNIL